MSLSPCSENHSGLARKAVGRLFPKERVAGCALVEGLALDDQKAYISLLFVSGMTSYSPPPNTRERS